MSQKSRIIFAALAAVSAFGAVQVASVEASPTLADRFQALVEPTGAAGINRTAKGDRDANIPQAAPARTVLLKVDSLADTSVLVRIPVQKQARNTAPVQPSVTPAVAKSKRIVACEPPVSVLTEVAKLLQPGRCVT
jgi:hypothetical protein